MGALGASTAWWHAQIERHPAVHRLPGVRRDLRWFDRYWSELFTPAAAASYAEWFPRPDGGIAGEWSPGYLTDFWVPEMLAAAAPRARILVLLCDPVERYAMARARAAGRGKAAWDDRDALGAFQRGLYAEQLRRWLAGFPRDQVLVLQEEACRNQPDEQLERTLAFIGLEGGQLGPGGAAAPERVLGPLPESARSALVEAYAPDRAELATLVPELDFGLWMPGSRVPEAGASAPTP